LPARLTVMSLPNLSESGATIPESHVAEAELDECITLKVSHPTECETSDNRFGVACRRTPNG
jgi:hypothetical protein